jgi:hypothetical protein
MIPFGISTIRCQNILITSRNVLMITNIPPIEIRRLHHRLTFHSTFVANQDQSLMPYLFGFIAYSKYMMPSLISVLNYSLEGGRYMADFLSLITIPVVALKFLRISFKDWKYAREQRQKIKT